MERHYKVFLSYHGPDRLLAKRLTQALQMRSPRVKRDLVHGEHFGVEELCENKGLMFS